MDIQIDRDKKREDGNREGDERRDRDNNGEGGWETLLQAVVSLLPPQLATKLACIQRVVSKDAIL